MSEEAVPFLLAAAPHLGVWLGKTNPQVSAREPGFASIARIVVEQSISLKAAEVIWKRLDALTGSVRAQALTQLHEDEIRSVGLSRAKARCLVELAHATNSGQLNIDALAEADDEVVRATLMSFRGIGRWTADMYLLLCLCRPDIWPAHDLALREGLKIAFELPERPSVKEADARGEPLRPFRSRAAFALWAAYLYTVRRSRER